MPSEGGRRKDSAASFAASTVPARLFFDMDFFDEPIECNWFVRKFQGRYPRFRYPQSFDFSQCATGIIVRIEIANEDE
jgi:hypothetical protein